MILEKVISQPRTSLGGDPINIVDVQSNAFMAQPLRLGRCVTISGRRMRTVLESRT